MRTLINRFLARLRTRLSILKTTITAQPPVLQTPESPLFPRLEALRDALAGLSTGYWEPAQCNPAQRLRLLEAKVEYLLDELYRLKSIQRIAPEDVADIARSRQAYQVASFDYQWNEIVYHDEFLSNAAWREKAVADVCSRSGLDAAWFRGRKVLDCGCGPGRHAYVFATLGARVVAFDLGDNTLRLARQAVAGFHSVEIHRQSILAPLPYDQDFDLVWCYGVLHHTGNTFAGLRNIARHVRPGGTIYLMLYAEPRRDNVFDYQYQHEVATLRQASRGRPFADKARLFSRIDGESQTLAWFDAISSEINDLYTFEEIADLLRFFGFTDIRRTMPAETMHNVVARRPDDR